ncbi:MAG: envelope stress response membrane protein PspB [Cellvibrionaceae bacterium]
MDTGDITGLVAVIMIFGIPISAIWAGVLKSRYRAQQSNISSSEIDKLENLTAAAEAMSERIDALESILDNEVPDWRDDHE